MLLPSNQITKKRFKVDFNTCVRFVFKKQTEAYWILRRINAAANVQVIIINGLCFYQFEIVIGGFEIFEMDGAVSIISTMPAEGKIPCIFLEKRLALFQKCPWSQICAIGKSDACRGAGKNTKGRIRAHEWWLVEKWHDRESLAYVPVARLQPIIPAWHAALVPGATDQCAG